MLKRFILLILLSMSYTYSQAIIPAQVQNANNLSTTSVITLEIDVSKVNSDNPNLGVLANQFEVYGVSNSSQTSIINGHVTQDKKLIISLGAKKAGNLVIPSIKIGNDQTNPISINIHDGGNQAPANNSQPSSQANTPSIIFEADANTKKAYPNNPFIYKIKLYFNVPINNVNLENIEIPNAQIEPYDKTKQYQERYQNHEYMVVEQKFIVTPTTSGVLHIPPAKIKGSVNDANNPTGNPFISRSTPFVRTSKAIDIDILAKPKNISAKEFFPAQKVTISDDWSIANNSSLDIGTPINHSITITANGASLANFPLINESQLKGFSYYEDKPKTDTRVINDEIVTTKTYKFTLIPKESGEYTFKPQAIKWLNVQTESLETINLQSRSFTINRDSELEPTTTSARPTETVENGTPNMQLIIWVVLIVIALIIAIYIIFKLIRKKQHNSKTWSNVVDALKTNNLELLIQSIILYVEQQTQKPMLTLEDIAKYYNSETLSKLATKINQARYRNATFSEANELVAEIQRLSKQKSKVSKVDLKEFYPK